MFNLNNVTMSKNGPFPRKESELNTYFAQAVAYVLANAARLLVSALNQNNLTAQWAAWALAYPKSQNPDTRTATAVKEKDDAKDALLETLRATYADIPESVLTSQDRATLGIAERSTSRTPTPDPTTKPIAQVDTSKRLAHTISFKDEDGSLAKPEGVRGCQIWVKIGAPAKDPSELTYLATDTKTPYTYQFEGSDGGKPAYYWLRWENTRGQVGPWSDEVMATIVG